VLGDGNNLTFPPPLRALLSYSVTRSEPVDSAG
jgi:hypothetical protein